MDVEFNKSKGKITGFCVNYRAQVHDEWKEVIRYDTFHKRLHLHRFWRPKADQVEHLEDEERPIQDYQPFFEEAKSDIEKNWRRYRRLFTQRRQS